MARSNSSLANKPIKLLLYKWAGKWGPFKVKIPCGECALTEDVIADTLATELAGIPVEFETREWLSNWWEPLPKGGWHAPIVMVEGEVVAQGDALNRGVLTEKIVRLYTERFNLEGTHLFGKETCPHCTRAKGYFSQVGVDYTYHDVVKNPRALYEMLSRVKPIIGEKTPVTVPQIWIDGTYVGGADHLSELLDCPVEANPERGQCSLSPGRLKALKQSRA
ncbi:MAG: glutaredoxin domain-containing protein [Pseudomonadota bacterium]